MLTLPSSELSTPFGVFVTFYHSYGFRLLYLRLPQCLLEVRLVLYVSDKLKDCFVSITCFYFVLVIDLSFFYTLHLKYRHFLLNSMLSPCVALSEFYWYCL
jgi:hypothetical protein